MLTIGSAPALNLLTVLDHSSEKEGSVSLCCFRVVVFFFIFDAMGQGAEHRSNVSYLSQETDRKGGTQERKAAEVYVGQITQVHTPALVLSP